VTLDVGDCGLIGGGPGKEVIITPKLLLSEPFDDGMDGASALCCPVANSLVVVGTDFRGGAGAGAGDCAVVRDGSDSLLVPSCQA
jgi:hypothetical protein